jgi:hypothetical protein
MTSRLLNLLICLALGLVSCNGAPSLFGTPTPTPIAGSIAARDPLADATGSAALPQLQARATALAAALQQTPPVLTRTDLADREALAQALALRDSRFVSPVYAPDGTPARSEIFGVYPARQSDVTQETERCLIATCYRVEMYNYALNLTTVGIVNTDDQQVLSVTHIPDSQPDIPPVLLQLALDIATQSAQVIDALGFQPSADMALMASTKTALNFTRCQRSHHLCVAPTFVSGERALWAIVDLTDGVLVGTRWTEVGAVPGAVTERSLQNEVVTAMYCDRTTALDRNDWKMDYILTSSDGLRISAVRFKDSQVLESAKLVDWHVSYSSEQGFGYSDAIGCPVFSQAAVVAFQGPTLEDIRDGDQVIGFALRQKFWSDLWPRPCNYYYEQRYEFYNDGRFRIVGGNVGRGCGNQGTYRPVIRIAFAQPRTLAAWTGSAWQDWSVEQWQLQSSGAYTAEGYQYRVLDQTGGGYYLEPGQGQFNDGGRGDDAYLYVTRHHPDRDEGDSDLVTIGPCCNEGYEQGPEKYIDASPEDIANQELIVWYVPQMKIDNAPGHEYCWADASLVNGVFVASTFPCYAGPLFVPVSQP